MSSEPNRSLRHLYGSKGEKLTNIGNSIRHCSDSLIAHIILVNDIFRSVNVFAFLVCSLSTKCFYVYTVYFVKYVRIFVLITGSVN